MRDMTAPICDLLCGYESKRPLIISQALYTQAKVSTDSQLKDLAKSPHGT